MRIVRSRRCCCHLPTLGIVNEELLRALLRTDKIKPSETIKLLEINRVKVQPDVKLHQLVRHEKWYQDCYMSPQARAYRTRMRSCWKQHDHDLVRYSKPLALDLIRPYLRSRLDRAVEEPCLFSVFMDQSINLNIARQDEPTSSNRQKLRQDMIASLDTSLVHRAGSLFNTLFDSHGLTYWLPHYDAAHLTVQPKVEDNLRLFYIFRVAYNATQGLNYGDKLSGFCKSDMDTLTDMLSHPPASPEYARLFALDCFNLATNSKSKWLLLDFFDSNTGRLLDTSSLPGRIWYVVKQGKPDLSTDLIFRALGCPSETPSMDLPKTRFALRLIVKPFVEAGEETHYGRTVIGKIIDCKDLETPGPLRRDLDPNSNSPIQQSMRAAMLSLSVHCSPSR